MSTPIDERPLYVDDILSARRALVVEHTRPALVLVAELGRPLRAMPAAGQTLEEAEALVGWLYTRAVGRNFLVTLENLRLGDFELKDTFDSEGTRH